MALVTSQSTLPDFEHEYHTVIVDTVDDSSKQKFTSHFPKPLENIVQVQLMAAHINGTLANHKLLHLKIDELRTIFSQRGKTDLETGDDNMINGVFGTLITDGTTRLVFKNEYPVIQQYYNPIRKLDRLNVEVLKETGGVATTTETCLIFRFICKKRNMSY
jgi:hypothetical protein|tara:strand:+ start:308 stop:790 length:483 start_codon:yes stop_codon:yes gene_type:complete